VAAASSAAGSGAAELAEGRRSRRRRLGRGVATGWAGVDMSTALLPEGVAEIVGPGDAPAIECRRHRCYRAYIRAAFCTRCKL